MEGIECDDAVQRGKWESTEDVARGCDGGKAQRIGMKGINCEIAIARGRGCDDEGGIRRLGLGGQETWGRKERSSKVDGS